MKVFLTGGTGFIGQPLAKTLLAQGWEVIALARSVEGAEALELRRAGATVVRGDVIDRASMVEPMQGADLVLHNAAHYEVGIDAAAARRMAAVNVDGTRNVLGLALELGIPRTLYVSSLVVYGNSGPQQQDETFRRTGPCRTVYERTKSEAHGIALELQARGLPLVIACPNAVVGPNDHSNLGYFLRLYLNGILPPVAVGRDTRIAFVDLNDLVRGLVLAAEKGAIGETYIFSGEAITLGQLVALWRQYPGHFGVRVWIPGRVAGLVFALFEPLLRWAGMSAFLSRETAITMETHLNYSSAKAQSELGWTHRTAAETWHATVAAERRLLAARRRRGLVPRLKPLPAHELPDGLPAP